MYSCPSTFNVLGVAPVAMTILLACIKSSPTYKEWESWKLAAPKNVSIPAS